MENLIGGLATGLAVWLFTWGINRIYLTVKLFVS